MGDRGRMAVVTLTRPPAAELPDPLDPLTRREREILALMAKGYSNAGLCARLHLSEKTVETHVGSVFRKLDLPPGGTANRRVLAVLIHLASSRSARAAA